MKRFFILTLVVAILASGCSAIQIGQSPANVDTQATVDASVQVAQAQTQAAQPSPTTVPPTDTSTPVIASSPTLETVLETNTSTPTATSAPNLTTTPPTATVGTENPTLAVTATKTVPASGAPTLTPTLGILKYGTLPPAVPSAGITIYNKSKAQAYISLQNDAPDQPDPVLEYPVKKEVRVKAPLGYYVYVVWVGGRKIVGEFVLHQNDDLTITIYKDKVTVE